jgi:hypothetical protein
MGNHTVNGIKRAQIPASQKFVLWALADSYNEKTGQCNPGINRLCTLTGLCDRAVRNALKGLKSGGWIEISGSTAARRYRVVKWMPDREDWTHGPGQYGPILNGQAPASHADEEADAPARDADEAENDRHVVPSVPAPDAGCSGISFQSTGTKCRQKQKEPEFETESGKPNSPPAAAERGDPRHQEIFGQWGKNYEEVFGYAYVFERRDASGLKRFLVRAPEVSCAEFLEVAAAGWEIDQKRGFHPASRHAHTIAGLCDHWNDIRGEVARIEPQTRNSKTNLAF